MKVRDIASAIESFAPPSLQESYDNSGLVVGRYDDEVQKALLAVDVTEEVLDEAEREGCDLVITHHPIIFSPLKRFNSATYVERCVERAIRKGIALYAAHTNLDSTPHGMSWQLGSMIGLDAMSVLEPRRDNAEAGFGVVGTLLFVLIAMATYRTPAVSLMPDVTVKPLRSKANAIINLMGSAGGILALGYMALLAVDYKSYLVVFIVLSVLMIVALGVFLLTVNEKKLVAQMHQEAIECGIETFEEVSEETSTKKEKMPKDVRKSFLLILTSIVFWFMAYNAATSKFSVYATSVLDFKNYSMPLMVAQGAAIISYLPIGMLSSKLGRKKTILIGIIELFSAFLLGAFATDNSAFLLYGIMALAGIGWATINVNSYPMVVEMAKGSDVGKYTGIYYTASMSAQIITPIFSGFLMDTINMRVLFPYSAIFCALAFTTMLFVRHGDAKQVPENKSSKEIFENTINALDD